jgi:alpha-L-fucosidase 2
MLLQNPRHGEIYLLPALPKALGTGYVKGLRAKGGITVNIWFEHGRVTKAELTLDAHLPKIKPTVKYNGTEVTVLLEPGKTTVIA